MIIPSAYPYAPTRGSIIAGTTFSAFFCLISLFGLFSVADHEYRLAFAGVSVFLALFSILQYRFGMEAIEAGNALELTEEYILLPYGIAYRNMRKLAFSDVVSCKVVKMKKYSCIELQLKSEKSRFFINEALLQKDEFTEISEYLQGHFGDA